MTPDERKELISRTVQTVWNTRMDKRRMGDTCQAAFAADSRVHDLSFSIKDVQPERDSMRRLLLAGIQPGRRIGLPELRDLLLEACDDLELEVHERLADGDLTAHRWTIRGSYSRRYRDLSARSDSFEMSGVSIDRWEGDEVVEEWTYYDALEALPRLGIDLEVPVVGRQR